MNFKEKKQAFNQLHDINFLGSDRELLRRYQPYSLALCSSGSPEKQENEVLWELLDFAGEDEIRSFRNRKVIQATQIPAVTSDQVAVSKKKVSTRKRSTRISGGRIWKMRMFKKPLFCIMTVSTVSRECGSWMLSLTIGQRWRRLKESLS